MPKTTSPQFPTTTVQLPADVVATLIGASFRGRPLDQAKLDEARATAAMALVEATAPTVTGSFTRRGARLESTTPVIMKTINGDQPTTWGKFVQIAAPHLSLSDISLLTSALARGGSFSGGSGDAAWTVRRTA